jgi:prolyl oligopeptidase
VRARSILYWKRLAAAVLLATAAGALAAALGCGDRRSPYTNWIEYPAAERVDQVDDYYGVEVPDPYRWLEDEHSEETKAWLAAQDEIAERLFAKLPERAEAELYLDENWIDGVTGVPVRKGHNTFHWESVRGLNHPVLYFQRDGAARSEVAFDLNDDDPDGTRSTLPVMTVSPEGRYVSYEIHNAGADAAEIRIFDTAEGVELEETIPTSYSWISAWLPDESGFFYSYLELASMTGGEPVRRPGVYLHRIGTPIAGDVFVYDRPWNGMFVAEAKVADDESRLLIADLNMMGSRGGWGVRPIDGDAATKVTWLIDPEPKYHFAFAGTKGQEVFLVTDYEAPNWRIVAADIDKPGMANLREVVPESQEPISMYAGRNEGRVLTHGDLIYVTYIQHNAHVIRVFDLQGAPRGEIELPFLGSVSGMVSTEGDPIINIGLQSFLVPHSVYTYDTDSGTLKPSKTVEVPPEFESFEVKRVFYNSKDGTRIPMTIMKHADTPVDGKAKVLLYGYGGWGIPLMPRFDNWHHAWLHWGGIYAIANLRGGGEYGEAWHQAGQFLNKQNVFDDFAAAAEYLVREGYTTSSRITIRGGSNGGLLTAACYNQRPELFGAVISEVAAVDLLRLPDSPIGATISMELGDPSQSKEMFEYLLGYSPLQNVRHRGPYPPILHMVGENDPRCKPGHIYKYVAEMQRDGAPERVAVLRVVRGAGHGSHRKAERVAWCADELAFAWAMTD